MNRTLVSIAVSRFAGGLDDLPFAAGAAAGLTAAAAMHGYTTVDAGVDPTAADVARTVLAALDGASDDEVLIVHVVSHGRAHGGSVQVFGSDGKANSGTSLDSWISDATGVDEHEDPWRREEAGIGRPWTLFLVDVCGAGRAARMQWEFDIADGRRRAWVIAGCLPERQGFSARFTRAAATVLGDVGRLDIHPSLQHVPLDRVAQEIREEVDRLVAAEDGFEQTVVATRVDMATRVTWPPFFDNPHYRPSVSGQVRDDLREFAVAVEDLFDAWHFMSRASGHAPNETRPLTAGGTFRGRGTQLRVLSAYLEGRAGRSNLHLVTGTPGVGKSALLGMLVCAAHPVLADKTRELWWARRDDLPAVVGDLAAVHAYEQDIATVLGQVAAQLGLLDAYRPWTVAEFVGAIRSRERPPVLVVDAVDEAVDPAGLSRALRELADATREDRTPACRLLVGARSGPHWRMTGPLLERATAGGELTDLDDEPREQLRADLSAYVDDLLRTHPGYQLQRQTEIRRVLATGIAGRLAAPVVDDAQPRWGEFLVAGLFVNYLSRRPAPLDPADAAAIAATVPRTLPGVLELDLAAPEHPWFHPTLATLAHAFGAGMPRRVVEACAPVFAPEGAGPASRVDIADALERGRFYLRRDVDSRGTTLYRLFHKALTDHLQRGDAARGPAALSPRAANRAILARLTSSLAGHGGWRTADPYLLRHALDHAAAADEVDTLLTDPAFMVHADPVVVARHLHRATTPAGRVMAMVYRTSYSWHRQLADRPEVRHAVLLFDAVRHQQSELARRLGEAMAGRSDTWQPVWATATTINSSLQHTLVGHRGAIRRVVCHRTADGAEVAVTASADGTVRIWDLDDGGLRHVLTAPNRSGVVDVLCSTVDGDDVVVAAAGRDALVWRIADGTLRAVLGGHPAHVAAVACTALADGTPLAVTADPVGGLRTWELATSSLRQVLGAAEGGAEVLTVQRSGDEPCGLAASATDGTIRLWNFANGECVSVGSEHTRLVRAIACEAGSGPTRVVSAGVDGAIVCWNNGLTGPRTLTRLASSAAAMVVLGTGADAVAVSAHTDGAARVWPLDPPRGAEPGTPSAELTGHTGMLQAVAGMTLDDGTRIAVTGSADGTARVWDIGTGATRHVLTGHGGGVTAVACARLASGRSIAITGGADRVARVWDLTGPHQGFATGAAGPITAMAWGKLDDGTPLVAGAGGDATVRLWHAGTGHAVATLEGHDDVVNAVTFTRLASGALIAITVSTDGTYRSWDLPSGRCRHTFRALSGRRTVPLVMRLMDGTDALVVTTPNLTLELCDLADGTSRAGFGRYLSREAPISACRTADGTDVVIAQLRDGRAQAWRLVDGVRVQLPGITGEPLGAAVWCDGADVVTAASDGRDLAVTLLSNGVARRYSMPGASRDSVLAGGRSSGGRPVVVMADAPGVAVWSLEEGRIERVVAAVPAGSATAACHAVIRGAEIVAVAAGNLLYVSDLAEGGPSQALVLPEPAHAVVAGPDGSLLVGFGPDLCRLAPPGLGRSAWEG